MEPKERILFITGWILDYCSKMPKKPDSLVVGVSGGIDSAVVSTICAASGFKTFALSMPIKQIKEQDDLSKIHCDWLFDNFKNVDVLNINLDSTFGEFEKTLGKNNNEHAFANTRARLRMSTLYQVAGSNNGIVVGTGNKVEDFGVGFYTKYGDGGVDISPIADCTKTQVWDMGKELKFFTHVPYLRFGTIRNRRNINSSISIFSIKTYTKVFYFISRSNYYSIIGSCDLIQCAHS